MTIKMKRIRSYAPIVLTIFSVLFTTVANAEVRLPRLLSDGVILQREVPVTIWGWADEGEKVQLFLNDKAVAAVGSEKGRWRVEIAAQPAGGPHQLRVTGNNSIEINDVYFGDVWVASGQSNMELMIERVKEKYPQEIAAADYPLIRQFKVAKNAEFKAPREDFAEGQWVSTNPESVIDFSAVAFFFARSIQENYKIPIGIISSSYGGAAAESWMSEAALEDYPHYLEIARSYRDEAYLQKLQDDDQAAAEAWMANVERLDAGLQADPPWSTAQFDHSDWQEMTIPGYWADTDLGPVNGVVWFRKTIELPPTAEGMPASLMMGRIIDADTTFVNGIEVGNVTYQYPPRRYQVAAGILKAGENTIAVRVVNERGAGGFVLDKPYWLQLGDMKISLEGPWKFKLGTVSEPVSRQKFIGHRQPLGFYNAMLAPLLNMRIKGVIWYQGETNVGNPTEYYQLFPAMIRDWRKQFDQGDFPFVFVQLANFLESAEEPVESSWAETRDAQLAGLSEPNTAMAVAIDVGEWNDIHPLNKKAVGERLALAARSVAYGETALVSSGPLFVSLQKRDAELVLKFDHVGSGLKAKGDDLRGFAIAGADRVYKWANAKIEGARVVVWNEAITKPVYVRYAWADNPVNANLYNQENLPASPFQGEIATR